MAISGGATSAYFCEIVDCELRTTSTTRLRSACATVDDALQRLAAGERVVVAGSDVVALRDRLLRSGAVA